MSLIRLNYSAVTCLGVLAACFFCAGALACLCGRSGRYMIKSSAVVIGRSSDSKGDVDVDLSKEGPAVRVSRLHAQLNLMESGTFGIKNIGRRSLVVNGNMVSSVHLCLGVLYFHRCSAGFTGMVLEHACHVTCLHAQLQRAMSTKAAKQHSACWITNTSLRLGADCCDAGCTWSDLFSAASECG